MVPGSSAAVFVKEIDVHGLRAPLQESITKDAIPSDWKKAKLRKRTSLQPHLSDSASVSDPLLRFPFPENRGNDNSEKEGVYDKVSPLVKSRGAPVSPPRVSEPLPDNDHPEIQYARMANQSSLSLFGEDDSIMPEDMASLDAHPVIPPKSMRFGMGGYETGEDSDSRPTLKVRPLPTDATDERVVQLPPRNSSIAVRGRHARRGRHRRTYGSFQDSDLDDIGGSGDESQPSADFGEEKLVKDEAAALSKAEHSSPNRT